MSIGSDYLAETEYEREQAIKKAEELYFKSLEMAMQRIWITKDGNVLFVGEMDTSHIKNCINMLERNNHPGKVPLIGMFLKELSDRGEQG